MGFIDTLCTFLNKGTNTIGGNSSNALGTLFSTLMSGNGMNSRGMSNSVGSMLNNIVNKINPNANQYQNNYQQNGYNNQRNIYNQNNQQASYQQQNNFTQQQQYQNPNNTYSLANILRTDDQKCDFIILLVQIGTFVAKCDNQFTTAEQQKINEYISKFSNLSNISPQLRSQIGQIVNSTYTFDDLTTSMDYVLNTYNNENERAQVKQFVRDYIREIVFADNDVSNAENNFNNIWQQRY